ncbi:MAG: hypothetical protein H5T46_05290 [Archaeoglobi archaeon]|nr:hypothetical protein [Candidatus Mnemosynella sp.]
MQKKCPGSSSILRPKLELRVCPRCGNEVEIFSDEMKVECENCGFIIYNDLQLCIQWCPYAKECIGDENYERIRREMNEAEKKKGNHR